MADMRIAVMGAGGRMGRELARAVHASDGCVLAGGVEQSGSEHLGRDVGEVAGLGPVGAPITDDALELFTRVDAVLDFTAPKATVEFAGLAANARIVHVIGTTGFTAEDEAAIAAAARHATIIKAGNMSLGVNLLVALTRRVAEALDADFDIEIVEMHHRHKVDAPSGTALMLGRAAADGRKVDLDEVGVRARDGHT
ncbi:MAG: 4-hydroxy-tetrahydrodipicolinate reductase, partial [Hyphomicrobiaceae bacterium]